MDVARAVARYASTDELVAAEALAIALERLRMVEFLRLVIEQRQQQ